ncbi:uncharacterized protein METZ01_LOCUS336967, partial [marine metagenome]
VETLLWGVSTLAITAESEHCSADWLRLRYREWSGV